MQLKEHIPLLRKVVQNLSGGFVTLFLRSFSVARKSVFVEIAQMVERSLYTAEATGSMPVLDIPLFHEVMKSGAKKHFWEKCYKILNKSPKGGTKITRLLTATTI